MKYTIYKNLLFKANLACLVFVSLVGHSFDSSIFAHSLSDDEEMTFSDFDRDEPHEESIFENPSLDEKSQDDQSYEHKIEETEENEVDAGRVVRRIPAERLPESSDEELSIEFSETSSQEPAVMNPDDLQPIHLGERGQRVELAKPDSEKLSQFLDSIYTAQSKVIEQMKGYVVGIKGQDRLLTLADAYKERLISAEETGAILTSANELEEGETSTLHLSFGLRSGEDIVIGRYPSTLVARPRGLEGFNPNDPSLAPMTKWLQLLGHMTWVRPYSEGGGVAVNHESGFTHDIQIRSFSASLSGNHWSEDHQRALSGGAGVNGSGLSSYFGSTTGGVHNGMWMSLMEGWGGLGYSGKFNIEEQQLGLSSLGIGAFIGGWKDYIQFGASVSVVGPGGSQMGLGGVITLSKDRITSYLKPYQGEYKDVIEKFVNEFKLARKQLHDELTITHRLADLMKYSEVENGVKSMKGEEKRIHQEIERLDGLIVRYQNEIAYLEGKHFVEVIDSESKGLRIDGGAYIEGIGLGFRAGTEKGQKSVHRFYSPIERAQELMRDGDGSRIALMRLPKKFDKKGFPDLKKPHKMKVGEEVVTTLERTFYGSLVIGMEYVPGLDVRAGVSNTVTGTFEFGARKLPGNKLEVTIKPSEITEMGAFLSAINVIGPQLSAASTIALAMRMTFIFDLNNKDAVDTYSLLLTGGVLPIDFSADDAAVGEREAENLLDVAIIHRKALAEKGILLTYLEKADIPAKKFYTGIGVLPALSTKRWAGLTYEYLNGHAKVVSTNSHIAVSRTTEHVSVTKGRGHSGKETTAAYSTIKRSFVKSDGSEDIYSAGDDISDGYVWRFKGLTLRARLSDTKILGGDHKKMIETLNSMFHANVRPFESKHDITHKQDREILLERKLSSADLDMFDKMKQSRIDIAVRGSGIKRSDLTDLIAKLEDKGHNQMANILNEFVSEHGIKGVSAIHLMLKGGCRNLVIRTSSNAYSDPLKKANQIEALYTNPKSDGKTEVLNVHFASSQRKVRKIYKNINSIIDDLNQALADLDADPLFEGEEDLLKFEHGQREKKSALRSKLLAAKDHLIDLMDLEKQEFGDDTILKVYSRIKPADRLLNQRLFLMKQRYKFDISMHESRRDIAKRWTRVQQLIKDIRAEQEKMKDPIVRKVYCEIFSQRRDEELKYMLAEATKLLDLSHLRRDAKAFLAKMRKPKIGIFPSRAKYREIAAHMEQLLFADEISKGITQI